MPLKGPGCVVHRVFKQAEGREYPLMKGLTFRCQRDAVPNAIEQLEIQRVFQGLYLSADRALGDSKLLGRTCDAQAIAYY